MARLGAAPGWGLLRWAEAALPGRVGTGVRSRRLFKLARVVGLPADERYVYSFLAPFTEPEKLSLLSAALRQSIAGTRLPVEVLRRHYARLPALRGLQRRQYGDLKHTLPSEMLTKTDSMTMAASLEARPP